MTDREILEQVRDNPFKRGYYASGEPALDRRHQRVINSILHYNTFLEVGPGIGKTALYLSEFCDKLELLDITRDNLDDFYELVQMPVPIHIFKNLNQWKAIEDNSYDAVIACEVVEHVLDYQGIINEMIRVAQHKVVLTTPLGKSFLDPDHKHFFAPQDFEFIEQDYSICTMATKNRDVYHGQLVLFIEIYK